MTRRMIDSSMWENEKFGSMPMGAQLLQIGMINHADDQGRIKAHPVYLSKTIFPYSEEVSTGDIKKWLGLLFDNETIVLYEADGKQYAQMTNWWKYQSLQYAQPSEYPRPVGWQDRVRYTLTKGYIVTCNWMKVNGETVTDTCDMDGNPLPKSGNGNAPPPPSRPPNQPVDPSVNGYSHGETFVGSPESTGEYQGVDSGERTIEDQFNLIEDQLRGRDDRNSEIGREASPSQQPISVNGFGHRLDDPRIRTDDIPSRKQAESYAQPPPDPSQPYKRSEFYDPRKIRKDGTIREGTGVSPVEVTLEFIPFNRNVYTPRAMKIIAERVTDNGKWRTVLEETGLRGFKPHNIADRLEIYDHGWRNSGPSPNGKTPVTSSRVELSIAGML